MAIRPISFFLFSCILLGASHIHAAIISNNVTGDFIGGGGFSGMFSGEDLDDDDILEFNVDSITSFMWEFHDVPNLANTNFDETQIVSFSYDLTNDQEIEDLHLETGLVFWKPYAKAGFSVELGNDEDNVEFPIISKIEIFDPTNIVPEPASAVVLAGLLGMGLVLRSRRRNR